MVNVSSFANEVSFGVLSAGLSTGLLGYLLSEKRIFNVQLISPKLSFVKGALIGSSMVAVSNLIFEFTDILLKNLMKDQNKLPTLLGVVTFIAVPGYFYGRSSPISVISLMAFSFLGVFCEAKIRVFISSLNKSVSSKHSD